MSTIIFTCNGTITIKSSLDQYEQQWIQNLAEQTNGKFKKEQVEDFLLKRDHIVIGGE